MKIFLECFLALSVAFAARAQNASLQPKFEVASLKRAARCELNTSIDPGTVTLSGVPLKAVLAEAFKVKADQIQGPS